MNIAYVRVSTVDQNEARQIEALEKYGIERWYTEKISGKDANRPKLQEMLEYVREGDTVHIHDLSRLARSTADLLVIVEQLTRKGVHLVSNKENIDSSTPTGKLMLTMIGAINEFERTNILERTREGIAIAKREGVYKGRKPINVPENWDEVIKVWRSGKITAREAMEQLGLKPNTFYRLCSKNGIRCGKKHGAL
ncbi:MAG: recombinase family protein [Flexilinea sp.]|nr:recombinase family protein [Flexilinea sp.]